MARVVPLLAALLLAPLPAAAVDVAVTAAGPARCAAPAGAEIAATVAATNALRAQHGLPKVRANAALSRAAAQQACTMASLGRMRHEGARGEGPSARVKSMGYRPRMTAENIAAGPYTLPQALSAWEVSAGHRTNILNPAIREVGIGVAVAANGRTRFYSAVYAAPR